MRFLIGIVTGAALTLLTATALDAPTRPTLERLGAQARALWQGTLEATSAALFEPTDVALVAPDLEPVEPESTPATPAATPRAPAAFPSPAAGVDIGHGDDPAVDPHPTGTAAEAPPLAPLGPPEDGPDAEPEPAFLEALLAEADARSETSTAAVWVPFHSEVSARGFARRLGAELGHPFEVERTGPGSYQVVFGYASADQRHDLELGIAEVTGR